MSRTELWNTNLVLYKWPVCYYIVQLNERLKNKRKDNFTVSYLDRIIFIPYLGIIYFFHLHRVRLGQYQLHGHYSRKWSTVPSVRHCIGDQNTTSWLFPSTRDLPWNEDSSTTVLLRKGGKSPINLWAIWMMSMNFCVEILSVPVAPQAIYSKLKKCCKSVFRLLYRHYLLIGPVTVKFGNCSCIRPNCRGRWTMERVSKHLIFWQVVN